MRDEKHSIMCHCMIAIMVIGFCALVGWTDTYAASGGVILGSDEVGGGSTSGGDPGCNADSANLYREDCAGASWIYYQSVEATDEDVLFAPVSGFGSTSSSAEQVKIPAVCSNGGDGKGGFWHYGINAASAKNYYNTYSGVLWGHFVIGLEAWANPGSYSTYSGSDMRMWGHWMTVSRKYYSWIKEKLPGGELNHKLIEPGQPDIVYYEAVKVAENGSSTASLIEDYKKALTYSGENADGVDSIPSGVYIFCYWEGMDKAVYAQSKASAGSASVDTGIVSSWASEIATTEVQSGESVDVKFEHSLYSSAEVSADWKMTIEETKTDGLEYVIESGSTSILDSGKVTLNNKIGDYYAKTISTTNYKIKFTGSGTYTRCEQRYSAGFPGTRVCVEIRVRETDVNYTAVSNVSVRNMAGDVHWETTGITSNGSAIDVMNNVSVNKEIKIVFSHNIYANKKRDNISWVLNRGSVSGKSFVLVNTETCGNSGMVNFRETDNSSQGNYFGSPVTTGRQCTDGKSDYIARDQYTIKFTSSDGWAEICQTVMVNGIQKTEACAKATAEKEVIEYKDKLCDRWIPKSYLDSNDTESGTTSVVAKIKNTELGEDWSDMTYAKPTDEIDWAYCYYPGVQRMSETEATTNHVSERSGYPDDDYTLYYKVLSNSFFGTWQNLFTLSGSGGFSPRFNGKKWNYNTGDDKVSQYATDDGKLIHYKYGGSASETSNEGVTTYTIAAGEAGDTYYGEITSGIPKYASITHCGPDKWRCHYRCDESACGTHCCGWETTCSTDDDGKESCSTSCVAECCNYCYADTCKHDDDYISNSRSNSSAKDDADVNIPYNFINSTSVRLNASTYDVDGVKTVYAGEKVTIGNLGVTVKPRPNGRTQGTYATQVDDAKIVLISFVSNSNRTGSRAFVTGNNVGRNYDICRYELDSRYVLNGDCTEVDNLGDGARALTLNAGGYSTDDVQEWYKGSFNKNYNVYDSDAGNWYCVVSAVYPYTVVGDTDMNSYGTSSWYISSPDCAKIAKEPSVQVWGGSVYSENTIKTFVSEKSNLRDLSNSRYIYSFSPFANGSTYVFGSWAEQSVVANGAVNGFASGAATDSTGSVERANPSYCGYRVPLSFANSGAGLCPNSEQTGESNISVSTASRDALVNYWWVMDAQTIEQEAADLARDYRATTNPNGNALRYVYSNGDIYLTSSEKIGLGDTMAGVTYVVRADRNITIAGDIEYIDENDIMLSSSKMIPKVIVYAAGNINIKCSVNRIDAVLVTNGYVNTCSDLSSVENPNDNINDAGRSRQLTINGAIMANQIYFNRTYGAGAGAASGVPAEIVNYDVSAILWGREMAEANDFETMTTVYQNELAPRY